MSSSSKTEMGAALVTGASRGIGRSIALRLATTGCPVTVNYMRSVDEANQVASDITDSGGRAIAVQGNVGIADDRQRMVDQTLEAFGSIDILVNNAGITSPGRLDLLEANPDNWDLVFDTNLKGPFFLSQRVANEMVASRKNGVDRSRYIINISSISAFAVSLNRADYCIAKSAMQMMTWLFADRLAEENVRVYELCPGVIASDMTAPVKEKYDRLIEEGLSPIRRWGQGDDVASAVYALVTGGFPFSTGETIKVDGGYHIRRL